MKWENKRLGDLRYDSPLELSDKSGDMIANFVKDNAGIRVDHNIDIGEKISKGDTKPAIFELAGPRKKVFYEPSSVRAAIVTCGGLCPGLNDVIRSLVMQMYYHYKVKDIIGIRYGYQGMTLSEGGTAIPLKPSCVERIHTYGGSLLGSSRGPQSPVEMVDFLQRREINVLFTIGGDGTLRGAMAIQAECEKRGYMASVIGIPKTIDNDIAFIDRSFGFSTAVEKATEVLSCAHVEAHGAVNGIGLVKLMGRHCGFIAAKSTLASGFVNVVLVPEVPFDLNGENGLLAYLEKRLENRGHAVIAVAEGAGQDLFDSKDIQTDESGNKRPGDIGLLLKKRIESHFIERSVPFTLKYIDPSYIIRSTPANTEDNVYCTELGQQAVHAAFAGRTETVVGSWHREFVMIPMKLATSKRKAINPDGPEWLSVLQSTGQRPVMKNT
jgi:6-phosphofructokinase 1